MTNCLKRLNQRHNVTLQLYKRHMKFLQAVEEELCRTLSCEHLTELLSMLAAKKENHLELMLLKEIEEDTTMDEL